MVFAQRRAVTIIGLSLALAVVPMRAGAQAPAAALTAAKFYGFTDAQIEKVLRGEVIANDLKEGSDKELAGVVAIRLPVPLAEFADIALEGELLKLFDVSIRSLHVWKPGESPGAWSDLQVDAAQRAMLTERYEAYRKDGPGELLTLAIQQTRGLDRVQGYAKALLDFPTGSLPGMEHRFSVYEQDVEGTRTFILSHRAAVRGEHDALITDERYFVSQGYVCRLIVSDCFEVPGGTLVFYVNRLFTDRVAGTGTGLKHLIGRGRMLNELSAKLKRVREQLAK
jgi:hypothetical protein